MKQDSVFSDLNLSIDIEERLRSERPLFWRSSMFMKRSVDRYKKFLLLIQRYPDERFVPTTDIDECWHIHLESPVAYYKDCIKLFGKLLDHNAGFGRKKSEKLSWKLTFDRTELLWMKEFNEPYKIGLFGSAKVCSSCNSRLVDVIS